MLVTCPKWKDGPKILIQDGTPLLFENFCFQLILHVENLFVRKTVIEKEGWAGVRGYHD